MKRISQLLALLLMIFVAGCTKDRRPPVDTCINERHIDPNVACPRILQPVCGCDGVTYHNDCEAKKAGVMKWASGECRKKDDCIGDPQHIDCSHDKADPVCGCDGKTYTNSCEAKKAGVQSAKAGKCPDTDRCIDESSKDPHAGCTREYDPVCGCDGKTYTNACVAKAHGVLRWKEGACGDRPDCIDQQLIDQYKNASCTTDYLPVCGCDGKTYGNPCEAKRHGIAHMEKGECPNNRCIDESKIDKHAGCPTVYDPVCGCDGKTYGNDCEAKTHGVLHWRKGKCQ